MRSRVPPNGSRRYHAQPERTRGATTSSAAVRFFFRLVEREISAGGKLQCNTVSANPTNCGGGASAPQRAVVLFHQQFPNKEEQKNGDEEEGCEEGDQEGPG